MALKIGKIGALDSIRGIAALIVVFSHFASIFFPSLLTGSPKTIRTHFDIFIYQSPLSIFFASGFAVMMFFILSGFVLTLKYFRHRQKSLFPAAIKRYIRLMPIVFISVMAGYFLMSFGLIFFSQLNQRLGLGASVYPFMFHPDLLQAISQGLVGVFSYEATATSSYNPVLWTIYYELLGAFLVFGLATLSRGKPKRWILYAIAAIAFINTFFCGFIIGLILADIYATKPAFYKKVQNLALGYKLFLLLFGLSIVSYQTPAAGISQGAFWNALTLFSGDSTLSRRLLQLTGGVILIILALSWVNFSRILELRVFRWLGKVSYALYAVHFLVIYSLTCWLFIFFNNQFNYITSAFIATSLSLPVILGLSWLLHKYIELPSIAAANKIGEWSNK